MFDGAVNDYYVGTFDVDEDIFHYIFIFGIHRNKKSCPLHWCIDGG